MEDNKMDPQNEKLDQEEQDINTASDTNESEDITQETDQENENKSETVENESEKPGKADKKFKKAEKKADKMQEKIDGLEDRVKRQLAEFENYRRRTDNEKSAMFDIGARSVVEKILPVIDNFERGLATVPEEDKETPFADGMNMIYKQLMTELDKIGVKVIETEGKEFNPDFHNAVMQVQNDELESGMIAQELQKGYTYNSIVVRHSMVAVVQ